MGKMREDHLQAAKRNCEEAGKITAGGGPGADPFLTHQAVALLQEAALEYFCVILHDFGQTFPGPGGTPSHEPMRNAAQPHKHPKVGLWQMSLRGQVKQIAFDTPGILGVLRAYECIQYAEGDSLLAQRRGVTPPESLMPLARNALRLIAGWTRALVEDDRQWRRVQNGVIHD